MPIPVPELYGFIAGLLVGAAVASFLWWVF